jgi:hypothetical protein
MVRVSLVLEISSMSLESWCVQRGAWWSDIVTTPDLSSFLVVCMVLQLCVCFWMGGSGLYRQSLRACVVCSVLLNPLQRLGFRGVLMVFETAGWSVVCVILSRLVCACKSSMRRVVCV